MLTLEISSNSSKINQQELSEFVLNHPNGNFFQSPLAFTFFYGIKGYQPIIIIAKENNKLMGVLLALLINEPGSKKFFSRRCIVWGGPLCNDNNIADKLLKALVSHTKSKSIYIEIRNLFNTNGFKTVMEINDFKYIDWLNYVVTVDEIDTVRKRINDSKRRQITKSLKVGATISEAKNISQLKSLYTLLSKLYKEKIRKPIPSFQFFEKFFSENKYGKIFVVEYKEKIIGGTVCPIYKDRIYEWYVCGLDREFKDVYPSVLATWAPIDYAAKNGLKYFDFLGAGSPNSDYGVREFKAQFGGELVNLGRYLRINNPLLYNVGKLGLKLLQGFKN